MAKQTKSYGNESISALKGADRVRKRPGVIFGSDGIDGCMHSVFEILSNSIDEARQGYGDKIILTHFLDNSLEVVDFGRGCPVDFNKNENAYNWELLFCELYAGGKYSDDENYEFSLGLNGLGLCATQYASEYMDVSVVRDGKHYTLHFEKGCNIGGLSHEPAKNMPTGTTIKWRPDLEVFTDIAIDRAYIAEIMKKQAIVNSGLLLILRTEEENGEFSEQSFLYKNGIMDYCQELSGENYITPPVQWSAERTGKDRPDKDEYKVKLSVALCFSTKLHICEYYHNSSFLEHGGSPEKAVKVAFVNQIDKYLKTNNKYQKNESKVTFQDIDDCLILISSSFSTQTSYENQTKKSITNRFIYECMADFLKHQLEVYFIENPDYAIKIAEQVLINKRSRENAEKTRLTLKKKLAGTIDLSNRVQKFVDCRTKDTSRRELYIVEGDSALGSCKLGRDSEFQAIMPVRGKILNCLKTDYPKIFKNDIITDVLKVMGCGVEVRSNVSSELSSFSLEGLRWNKIVICTDADVDGFQIRTLILTMLYRLTPTLINEGYVYIAESPLFEISTKSDTYFAYDQREKEEICKKLKNTPYTLQRSKGLGENEPEMMWLTTMNPETRRLIRITPSDAKATSDMFDLLLGDNLQGRKEYISMYGSEYIELADIS